MELSNKFRTMYRLGPHLNVEKGGWFPPLAAGNSESAVLSAEVISRKVYDIQRCGLYYFLSQYFARLLPCYETERNFYRSGRTSSYRHYGSPSNTVSTIAEGRFGFISTEKGVVVGRGEFLYISLISSLTQALYP